MGDSCPCCGAADKQLYLSCPNCGFHDGGFAENLEKAFSLEFGRPARRKSAVAVVEEPPRVKDKNRKAQVMSCPSCGKAVSESRDVCLFCGTELRLSEISVVKENSPSDDSLFSDIYDPWKESGFGDFVTLVLAIVGIVLGVVAGCIISIPLFNMTGFGKSFALFAAAAISIIVSCVIMGVYMTTSLRKNYLVAEYPKNQEQAENVKKYFQRYYSSVCNGVFYSFIAAGVNFLLGFCFQAFPHDDGLAFLGILIILGISIVLTIKGIYTVSDETAEH